MESALEVSAAHRAQVPFPPTAGQHSLLDQLVLQLLQKNPDLRYQTGTSQMNQANLQAKGLIHDLRAIGEGKASTNFVVGQVDQSARFRFPRRNCALGGH
jgi:hypothetical protein